MVCFPRTAAYAIAATLTALSVKAGTVDLSGRVVWNDINQSRFMHANLDGSDVQTLFTTNVTTAGFDIDYDNEQIYWQSVDGVFRADFDGANQEKIIDPTDTNASLPAVGGSTANVLGLEVDSEAGHVYWIDQDDNILRANVDGSSQTTLFSVTRPPEFGVSGAGSVGLALDTVNDYLFVTTQNSGTIVRANLDGSARQEIVTGLTNPQDMFIDSTNSRLYFTSLDETVRFSDLDGNGLTTVISSTDLRSPGGLAFDAASNRFFTTYRGSLTEKIQSFGRNGGPIQDLVTENDLFPQYFDVELGFVSSSTPKVPALSGLGAFVLMACGAITGFLRRRSR